MPHPDPRGGPGPPRPRRRDASWSPIPSDGTIRRSRRFGRRACPGCGRLPVGFSPHRPYLDALLLGTTLRAARRFRPDILHGHLHEGAAIASVVGRLVGRPAVADLQGSVADEMIAHGHLPARGPLPASLRRLERWVLRWPARLLPSSENFARDARRVWRGPARARGAAPGRHRPGVPAARPGPRRPP